MKKNESDLVSLILRHYKGREQIKLFRVHSGMIRAKGGVMHLAPAGTPDICGYKGSLFVGVECKNIYDKQSKLNPEQESFKAHACANGAIHIEARHLQDVIDIIGY